MTWFVHRASAWLALTRYLAASASEYWFVSCDKAGRQKTTTNAHSTAHGRDNSIAMLLTCNVHMVRSYNKIQFRKSQDRYGLILKKKVEIVIAQTWHANESRLRLWRKINCFNLNNFVVVDSKHIILSVLHLRRLGGTIQFNVFKFYFFLYKV